MKRYILGLLCITACLQISACDKRTSVATNEIVESETNLSEDEQKTELDSIYQEIDEANNYCNDLTKIVYEYWDYNMYETFFDRNIFLENDKKYNTKGNYSRGSFYGDAKTCYEYRDNIEKNMNDSQRRLKELEVSDGMQGYYNSVKNLYLNVDSYYSFASEFPEGYSKITYSQTFSKHQSDYNSLISELKFEQ